MVQRASCGSENGDECLSGILCDTLWFVPTKGRAEDECNDDNDGSDGDGRVIRIQSS